MPRSLEGQDGFLSTILQSNANEFLPSVLVVPSQSGFSALQYLEEVFSFSDVSDVLEGFVASEFDMRVVA